jgi:HEAT repeat protein
MFKLLTILCLLAAPAFARAQQEQRFTPVEGAGLQAKLDAAARQAAAAQQARFWTAYAFDVRPGVAVDFEFVSDDGRVHINNGNFDFSDWGGNFGSLEWDGPHLNPAVETRSLGVFLLRDASTGNQIVRAEVYNLARRREYSGYPVYWAGRASNEESLNLLRGLAGSNQSHDLAGDATRAAALHDDRRVPEILEQIARTSTFEKVRAQAVRSLGHPTPAPATREFLASIARDERESTEIRRAAITAYGRARDAQALSFLTSLYPSLTNRELQRRVVASVGENENRAAAAAFLVRVASDETDKELRKRAIAELGEIAGAQALGTPATPAGRADAETQLQLQAVAAIAKRRAPESVPLLIRTAQTHPKPEVRRYAFVLLGRTGDDAALNFLRSVLVR